MPNWCHISIVIKHKDKRELKKFYKLMKKWLSKHYCDNDFGHNWCGNLVGNSGVGTVDTGKDTDLSCKSWISSYFLRKGNLFVHMHSAWEPDMLLWVKILEKYLPEATLTYVAEEPLTNLYCTNDPEIQNHYCVAIKGYNDDSGRFATEEETIRFLQKIFETQIANLDMLLNMLNDSDYSDYIIVQKWRHVDITDWN